MSASAPDDATGLPTDLPTDPAGSEVPDSDVAAADAFGRALAAMVTPFGPDGRLDLDGARTLARHLVDSGCDGLVLSGTTGESPTTTDEEKSLLVRTVVDAVGDRARVVAGVGTNDTRHTLHLAEQAAAAGADGLLVVTPYYSRPPASGLLAHFRAVADATDLPVMLYDIPGRTGVRLGNDVLIALAGHPRVLAVKDATGDLFAGSVVAAESGLAYYSGDDALNLPWLASGAVGLVSVVAHVAPRAYADMIEAVGKSDLATARELHVRLLPAVRGVMTRTQGVLMAKAGLQLQGVLTGRTVRAPLPEATDDEVALLRRDLRAAGLLAS
jgi:4-hydroxy-tetrahydrodipicolinate synthase